MPREATIYIVAFVHSDAGPLNELPRPLGALLSQTPSVVSTVPIDTLGVAEGWRAMDPAARATDAELQRIAAVHPLGAHADCTQAPARGNASMQLLTLDGLPNVSPTSELLAQHMPKSSIPLPALMTYAEYAAPVAEAFLGANTINQIQVVDALVGLCRTENRVEEGLQAYRRGETEKLSQRLEALLRKHPGQGHLQSRVLTEMRRSLTDKLLMFAFKSDDDVVVLVPPALLHGRCGILDLVRGDGYTVEPYTSTSR